MAAEDSSEVYLDPNTYSNYKDISIVHTDISWEIRFDTKQLVGSVTHTLKRLNGESSILSLDMNDLNIKKVTHWTTELPFTISPVNETHPSAFGRCLNIDLETVKFHDARDESEKKKTELNDTTEITIEYETSSSAEAIQWLDAEITDGGKLPYLFTQCQPIGARTMLPCQDTPGNKFSYSATIKTPKKLSNGKECLFTAMMSAPTSKEFTTLDNTSDEKFTIHKIKQPRRIPSYLLALVVGDITQEIVGDRKVCAVVTEPVNMPACKWEFTNMQSYLTIAESICGEYRWASYGCLVLPSSFPYGGMENPNLTFVTPTLIAGDRSLVNVVAHEITHSWSGNLVTNESWEHFWLNEGWTRFIEMKIMERKVTYDTEALKLGIKEEAEKFTKIKFEDISKESKDFGARYQALQAMNGRTALIGAVNRFGNEHEFTKLNLSLYNTDPDDAFSSLPYEKGAELLMYIEDLVGGPNVFLPFIKVYFDNFAEKSINYEIFKTFLIEYFEKIDSKNGDLLRNKVDWETWLHKPGMSPIDVKETLKSRANKLGVENIFEMIEQVDNLVSKWINMKDESKESDNDEIKNGMNGWVHDQREMFLDRILDSFKSQLEKNEATCEVLRKKLGKMNEIYKFYVANGGSNDKNEEKENDGNKDGKSTQNREILFRFFQIVLECEEQTLYPAVVSEMLSCVGRMKYVRPLYRSLAKKDIKLAQESFDKHKGTQYHPICAKMVQKDLDNAKSKK